MALGVVRSPNFLKGLWTDLLGTPPGSDGQRDPQIGAARTLLLGRGQVASQRTTASSALPGAAQGEERVGKSHLRAASGRGRVGIAQKQPVCSSAGGISV